MTLREHAGLRRAAYGLLSVSVVVLLVWALAWAALPALIKGLLEKQASAQLGRQVSVQAIDIKPWSLEIEVKGLAIGAAGTEQAARPQLAIARIYLDASLESIWRLAPVIDAVQIQGVSSRVQYRGQGRYDLDDLLQKLNQPGSQGGKPLSFAIHNLQVSGFDLDFDDAEKGRKHTVRDLSISLPFISNMDSRREVVVKPHLAFLLNGTPFDSSAEGTPFAQTRQGKLKLKVEGFDLVPWVAYVSPVLPVQIDSAKLSADLQLDFAQAPGTTLQLSGSVQLDQARIRAKTRSGAPAELLAFERLKVDVAELRPLERRARLRAVELTAPTLSLARDKTGQLNLETVAGAFATSSGSARPTTVEVPPKSDWVVELERAALLGGQVRWHDQSTRLAIRWLLQDLSAEATAIKWPFEKPAGFKLAARLAQQGQPAKGQVQPVRLSLQGAATDRAVQAQALVDEFPLTWAAPYLADLIKPSLLGSLSADIGLDWQSERAGQPAGKLSLSVKEASVKALALQQGNIRWLGAQSLRVAGVQADLGARQVTVGSISLRQPALELRRDSAGRWMFESWQPMASEGASAQTVSKSSKQASPWSVMLKDIGLEDGSMNLQDGLPATPVKLALKRLSLRVQDFSTQGRSPVRTDGSVQIQAGQQEGGLLRWRGQGRPAPLAVNLELDATRLPVHALQPYLADRLRVDLLRADAGFKGQLSFQQLDAGPRLALAGDLALEDVRAHTRADAQVTPGAGAGLRLGEELLRWKVLSLRGLDLNLEPNAAARVNVRETVLSDFFARLVLDESGHLNLQGLVSPQESQATSAPSAAQPAQIRMGPISLTGGQVDFSDRFIKPNYSAQLSELTGRLGAFSSQPQAGEPALADVSLRGRAQGTATLEIDGRINPLASPLALDLKARVRELELAPLSAYSVRHAGHGIERGKLSVDLAYLVRPDGQLEASNRVILNQLTFGDKVENAPTSLPVKLAVALLADRQGVIDIDLPVSGSLNDPQFRLAPLIFKVIGNLIVKAVTAPFSLIARAFGGGDELSMVSFAPGSADLSTQALAGLDKVVDALVQRPTLQMTVSGSASLEAEREAYLRQQLHALLLAERRRAEVLAGLAPSPDQPIDPASSAYAELLKAVYARADIPRPRLADGSLQELPLRDMENLLLSHLQADDGAMRQLAVRRGLVVRDYLASRQIPLERLFLGTAKVVQADEKWAPRAELTLATP